jgi:predicted TIM-barrel fold metal-dependent hydrolase
MPELNFQPEQSDEVLDPIINCHTHIFTADHVPPWLGKSFLPFIFPYLASVPLVVVPARWWYRYGPPQWKHNYTYRILRQIYYKIQITIKRTFLLSIISFAAGTLLTIHVFFLLYDVLVRIAPATNTETIADFRAWLIKIRLLFPSDNGWLNAALILALLLFFPAGRNLIFFVFKQIFRFLSVLPGKETRAYLARYWNIGRFAFYKYQRDIFERLYDQYPPGTQFIILPMDMEYMAAGKPSKPYRVQMDEIVKIKLAKPEIAHPFVFVDPRRISDPDHKDFFDYEVNDEGYVELKPCLIKTYIEEHGFSGFKIYPAIGYYPFDERLLPLWKYAVQNSLPILTHCIRGTIFYRGRKNSAWDFHPVFEQVMDTNKYGPLLLPEIKNQEFINNFTHPLNYLCLLDDDLLAKLVSKAIDPRVKKIFGYDNKTETIVRGLSDLKICMGHFGGEDEWKKFFELDRQGHAAQLVKHPSWGIKFFELANSNEESRGKIEQLWKYTDWYSIICSMMLQYKNIYSDISYIIHDEDIVPLLRQTLNNPKLKSKVLFGTDFYVVRNHKSEKKMLAEIMNSLSQEDFDQIARANSATYLKNSINAKAEG